MLIDKSRHIRLIILLSIFAVVSCSSRNVEECIDYEELAFFNTIGGVLEMEFSLEPQSSERSSGNPIKGEEVELVSMKLTPEVFIEETESFRQLTSQEYNAIAFNKPTIKLVSLSDEVVEHDAPNKQYFTVRDLLLAVELTEMETRKNTNWFGGIDTHHIYFEGIYCENGKRLIYWGS